MKSLSDFEDAKDDFIREYTGPLVSRIEDLEAENSDLRNEVEGLQHENARLKRDYQALIDST